ncbi:hypothetical protein CAPTEDRAFT_115990, partial [Capitella teleta]
MQLPSITVLVCGLFAAYISHSMWTLYSLFYPKACSSNERCIPSYLAKGGRELDLWIYTSQYAKAKSESSMNLILHSKNLDIHTETETVVNVSLPRKTRNNGTLYVHSFITPRGKTPFSGSWVVAAVESLTTYMLPQADTFKLMGGEQKENQKVCESQSRSHPMTHWRSSLFVSVMEDDIALNAKEIPSELYKFLINYQGEYLPILYIDQISTRTKHLMVVNETCKEMPLTVVYRPISVGKLRMWVNMEQSMKMLHGLGFTEKDTDEMKGIFADTTLHFLLLTFLVAAFHLLFDCLAFKNDISYWRQRDSMVGLSTRTVLWRCVSTIIIFFYLMDEETSLIVLIPAGVGSIIELWKVTKAFKVKLGWKGYLPTFQLGSQSDKEKETQNFDSEAMKYLSYLLYP